MDIENLSIEQILADHKTFDNFFYTPLTKALELLQQRQNDFVLNEYLKTLPAGIPAALEGKLSAVEFRPIATPDFDFRRFLSITEMVPQLRPIVIEYHQDRFLNRNDCKFALGKICFNIGKSRTGDMLFEHKKIIDINDANTKKISDVKTHWGESLIDFHHEFLRNVYLDNSQIEIDFYDASEWLQASGGTPELYYKSFLSLFLKHGILFENFMLNDNEYEFTKNVVLPAFIEVYKQSGLKPLIVALQPTEIEGEKFWLSHPGETIEYVRKKMDI